MKGSVFYFATIFQLFFLNFAHAYDDVDANNDSQPVMHPPLDIPESRMSGKIVNGLPFSPLPDWMVYVKQTGVDLYDFKCGATMIGPNLVLTAAHCEPEKASAIVAKRPNLAEYSVVGVPMAVKTVVKHPNWDPSKPFFNDIAVVKVAGGESITKFVKLQSTNSALGDQTLIGWGRYWDAGFISHILMYANFQPISNQQCEQLVPGFAPAGILCATGKGVSSLCFGDQGGFFGYRDSSNEWVQSGVPVWTKNCDFNFPNGFARISDYYAWIIETGKKLTTCPDGQVPDDKFQCVSAPTSSVRTTTSSTPAPITSTTSTRSTSRTTSTTVTTTTKPPTTTTTTTKSTTTTTTTTKPPTTSKTTSTTAITTTKPPTTSKTTSTAVTTTTKPPTTSKTTTKPSTTSKTTSTAVTTTTKPPTTKTTATSKSSTTISTNTPTPSCIPNADCDGNQTLCKAGFEPKPLPQATQKPQSCVGCIPETSKEYSANVPCELCGPNSICYSPMAKRCAYARRIGAGTIPASLLRCFFVSL